MKKNDLLVSLSLKFLSRVVLLTIIGTSFLTFSSKGAKEDPYRVNLKLKNVSLSELVKEIQHQTHYKFFYNDVQEKNMGKITIDVKDEPLEEVLKKVFEDTKYTYRISGEQIIVIDQKEEKKTSPGDVLIEGKVIGTDGAPIVGASVLIRGTYAGVATNANGEFKMRIAIEDEKAIELEISFVGMKKQVIKVKGLPNPQPLTVTLEENMVGVDEVVINGYARIKKSSFTGASTQIKKEDILKVSQRNVIDVLQVFEPSLRIVTNNDMGSDPNTMPEFYIRGRTSVDGVKQLDQIEGSESGNLSRFALTNNPNLPIFILDGYEVGVEKVYDMDPNRIESITILKDAAATAIYGSRAANGIIMIESVTPELGKLNINYSTNISLTAPDLSDYNLMNAEEKLETEVLAGLYNFTDPNDVRLYAGKRNNVLKGVNTDWMAQPLQNQWNNSHSLFIDGGTEGFRFGASISTNYSGGVMKGSHRRASSFGMYLDYSVGKVKIRNHVTFDLMKSQDSPYGSFGDYTKQQPYEEFKDSEGKYLQSLALSSRANPLYEATLGSFSRSNYNTLTNNLSIDWYINKNLQFKNQFSVTKQTSGSKDFTDPNSADYLYITDPFMKGELALSEMNTFSWNLNSFIAYNTVIKKNSLNVSAGLNAAASNNSMLSSRYRGFPSAELNSVGHAREIVDKPYGLDNKTRLAGLFLSANYTYNNIYLADASLRFDGSSEFGADQRIAPFWSLGFGINFHNYEFMKSYAFINQLKIRATYGQTGKVNYPPYAARDTYTVLLDDWYTTGIGAAIHNLGNSDLKWEKTNNTNIGADISLFKSKIYVTGSWYNRETIDMITDVTIPSSAGFTSYKSNMGEVRNRGYEMTANYRIISTKDFDLNTFVSLSHNKGTLVKLGESLEEYNERVNEYLTPEYGLYALTADQAKPFLKYEEGGSLTSIYGMKSMGINPTDGNEIFVNRNGNLTSEWDATQQQIIGNTEPTAQGSFGFNLRYKQFTLYTTFMYEFGGQAYNQTLVDKVENIDLANYNADKRVLLQRWQNPGDVTPLKNIADRYVTRATSRFVQDRNELKFNSISLGYDFKPEWLKKIGLNTLRLQAGANDIVTISTIKQERGMNYPYARTFNFNLSTSF